MMHERAAPSTVPVPSGVRRGAVAMVLLVVAAHAWLASGCGEPGTGVVLTIHSSREVPGEVDRLLFRIAADGHPVKQESRDLSTPFPHTLGLDLSTGDAPITITVWAFKGELEITSVQLQVRPVLGEVVGAQLNL
jgi:hypothetical protein